MCGVGDQSNRCPWRLIEKYFPSKLTIVDLQITVQPGSRSQSLWWTMEDICNIVGQVLGTQLNQWTLQNLNLQVEPHGSPPTLACLNWVLKKSTFSQPRCLGVTELGQELTNILCKVTHNKYFGLVDQTLSLPTTGSSFSLSSLLQYKSSHRQYLNKWVWLCSNKTSQKQGPGAIVFWPLS